MDNIWLYVVLASACIISSIYFWYTYRHICEPTEGRKDDSNIIESRRLSMEIVKEIYSKEER